MKCTFSPKVEERGKLSAFVVSSEHDHLLGPRDLHGENQQNNLNREVSAVHIVSQKDILRGFAVTPNVGLQ
jgi:hypothetical protein